MRVVKNILLILFYFVAFPVIGALIGGYVAPYTTPNPTLDTNRNWELLDSPVRFSKISGLNSDKIWAQSIDGKLYFWAHYCTTTGKCEWIEVKNALENSPSPVSTSKTCLKSDVSPKEPPRRVVECTFTNLVQGMGMVETYFALLEDGTIWKWAPLLQGSSDVPGSLLFSILFGFVAGVIAAVIASVATIILAIDKFSKSR